MRRMTRAMMTMAVATVSVAAPLLAQKIELPECAKPAADKPITQFLVVLPLAIDRAHSRVVRAFTELGLPPVDASSGTNQVEWNSGASTSVFDEHKTRGIRATLAEDDEQENVTHVAITAYEEVTQSIDQTYRTSKKALTSKNGGYGFKVWCAAQTVADSLNAAAVRIRNRQATPLTDSAAVIPLPQ